MEAQQKLLAEHFQQLGGQGRIAAVHAIRHPVDGSPVPMANLIVRWHPEANERILLCTHYDTLPFRCSTRRTRGDLHRGQRRRQRRGHVDGAGRRDAEASRRRYGVDFVLFDGEEFIFAGGTVTFSARSILPGSTSKTGRRIVTAGACCWTWSATPICSSTRSATACGGRDTRPLVEANLGDGPAAGRPRVHAAAEVRGRDDHLPLHNIAGIPTCDIIDFDYPAWHTQGDTPDAVFRPEPGQGRLGAARVAEDGEVSVAISGRRHVGQGAS